MQQLQYVFEPVQRLLVIRGLEKLFTGQVKRNLTKVFNVISGDSRVLQVGAQSLPLTARHVEITPCCPQCCGELIGCQR